VPLTSVLMARLLGFFDLTLSAFMNRVKALHARVTLARLEYAENYCENSAKEKHFWNSIISLFNHHLAHQD
jgi:hypothetical protein